MDWQNSLMNVAAAVEELKNIEEKLARCVQIYSVRAVWNALSMELSAQDRTELQAVVGSGSYDGSVSARAQMVLWYDQGYRKVGIA
ncbi:MAG: hypothetical protein ACRDS9_21290, partial [Pseudonocardiaceae bacterium]